MGGGGLVSQCREMGLCARGGTLWCRHRATGPGLWGWWGAVGTPLVLQWRRTCRCGTGLGGWVGCRLHGKPMVTFKPCPSAQGASPHSTAGTPAHETQDPPPPGMGASSSGGWGGPRVCVCVWCVPWVAAPCLLGPLPGPPPHHTTPTDQPKLEEGSALATTAHTLRGWSPAFAHTPPHPTPPHRPQTYS